MSAENIEDTFKEELFKTYRECKAVLIPKAEYSALLENVKLATAKGKKTGVATIYYKSKYARWGAEWWNGIVWARD